MATSAQTGRAVAARTVVLLAPAIVVSNVLGAFVVYACAAWLLPETPVDDPAGVDLANLIAVGGYLLVAVPVGVVWGTSRFRLLRWLRIGERPDVSQRDTVLRGPLRLMTVHAVLWGLAVVAFGVLNTIYSPALGVKVMVTVVLGGLTTCAIVYLLSERLLRPAGSISSRVTPRWRSSACRWPATMRRPAHWPPRASWGAACAMRCQGSRRASACPPGARWRATSGMSGASSTR